MAKKTAKKTTKKATKKVAKKTKAAKGPQICIVTVTGADKVGIIAKISMTMAELNINIVDVNQKIMEDHFVMTMACDMVKANVNMPQVHEKLNEIAEDMDLRITFQHENIFKAMHRI